MSGTWTVSTEVTFSASHRLPRHEGMCSQVHGHNWTVRVHWLFDRVGPDGMTADFLDLRKGLERVVLSRFDHRHLNEVPPFDGIPPTSENIAAEIFRLCSRELEFEGGRPVEVELWETGADMVKYRE